LLDAFRRRRGIKTDHLAGGTGGNVGERFSAAYRIGAWVHSTNQQSFSGLGSEIAATAELRAKLPRLLGELGCRTLLDVGCGDWMWMSRVTLPCNYVGADVVPEVIAANRSRYERPGVAFLTADAIRDPLPRADVALCREILFHLSFRDAAAVLRNIKQAPCMWLLATTDSRIWFNADIRTADYRKINLEREPFDLPSPERTIFDGAVSAGRVLGLWRVSHFAS
jgi:SAM-dependent methyltransferase